MSNLFNPSELHGKVITNKQIKKLPFRNAFLEKDIFDQVNNDITKGKPLLFMPNDLHEMNLQDKKYGTSSYKIILFGTLLDGRRATVVLNGIKPYFNVLIPPISDEAKADGETESSVAQGLFNKLKATKYATPEKFEIHKGKRFKLYSETRDTFAKFYFSKLKPRRDAIKYVREQGYETTVDDTSCYYRVVCRDYRTTFSSWVNISDYTIKDYSSIRGSVFSININNYVSCLEDITAKGNERLAKDNLMTMCWDIETYSPDGQLPKPDNPDHKMFMIGITFQWHHSTTQILRVCIVDSPCAPRPNYLTIVCEDEQKLIKAFGKLVYRMKPEICLGFNDSDYDWPWLIHRAKEYDGVLTFLAECFDATIPWKNYDDNSILSYNFKKEQVKLEADAYAEGYTLKFPGYINLDVRTVFRQLYPTAEKSNLNFYLALNKLGGKKDMPYQELFATYREMRELVAISESCVDYKTRLEPLKQKMAEIADYCVIDSQRCHELMKIRSVILDRRARADLTNTSVFDAMYRADGMKVRNIVIGRGQLLGLQFSNIQSNDIQEEGKYPGAYVFPPKKGLINSKMNISERRANAAIMPELADWGNIDDETMNEFHTIVSTYGAILDDDEIACIIKTRAEKKQKPLPKCFIDFLAEKMGRPITGLDFSSLYPSLMMAYNLSPEYIIIDKNKAKQAQANGHTLHKIKFPYNGRIVRGWSIRHDNKIDPSKPDCKFGVYPMILKELFDQRKLMKVDLHKWESAKEHLETLPQEEFMQPHIQEEYENVCFNFNYYDSKQKALKLMMNTFYGESGNKRSPFFVLQLAGAITTAGQDNIKMVQRYVETKGCGVYYGDSVTGDTPLVVRNADTGIVMIKTIDDLTTEDEWKSYDQFKPGEPGRIEKQQAESNLQIWTEGDWHAIRRVIRHKTNKKMYRVNTHTGVIDVTEDHSLMRPDRTKIKPTELAIGTELMHSFPTEFPEVDMTAEAKEHEMVHCSSCDTNQPSYEFYRNRTTNRITHKKCRKCVWIKNANNRTMSLMTEYFSHYEYINCINTISKEEAWIWGFFMADGSCGDYTCPSGKKCSWAINNQNIRYLNQALEYLAICEPHLNFKLLDTLASSGVYKLVPNGHIKLIVEKYRKLFYDKRKYKVVPLQILNGSLEVRRAFYDGYYVGDGCKPSEQSLDLSEFCCKGKITSQCMYYLVKSLGYKYVSIRLRDDKPDIYSIRASSRKFRKNPIAVKKILDLPEITQDGFVYDIETSKGSFLGGVGALNVKNTDSLYLSMPHKHFTDIDKLYYSNQMAKEVYWSKMVDITFEAIKLINENVNNLLKDDNGTKFLKMAFEESLFPVAFLAKKKYYGIPHISVPNFNPKKLFIRGLEVKKRGVSDFLKKVCMGIMWDSVSLNNLYTLMDLVQIKIDHIYNTKWDFKDFIMTDVFKPLKKNVKVHTFATRMLAEGMTVKPYERFQYVIVKKNPFRYDERGRKTALSIGDKMEFSTQAEDKNMAIDLDYYMQGSINGQLARLITYADIFHMDPVSTSADDMKTADDKTYANACKYIDNYCAKYYTNYSSKGKIYQSIFKMANSAIIDKVKEHYNKEVITILNSSYDRDNLEEWLETKAEKEAIKSVKGYGVTHVTNIMKDIPDEEQKAKMKELQDMYFARKSSISHMREDAFLERKTLLQRQIRDNLDNIISVLNHHTKMVNTVSTYIKQTLDIDNLYNNANAVVPSAIDELDNILEIDQAIIQETAQEEINSMLNNDNLTDAISKMKFIYINMVSNYTFIHKTRSIIDYLIICRNKSIGLVGDKPKTFDTKKYIKNNIDDIIKEIANE